MLFEKIRNNVFLVNNTSVWHGNIKLIFSTLWTKISPSYQWQIEKNLSDFHWIKNNGFRFSTEHYNDLHDESFTFIQNEIKEVYQEKIAVFTHHCPTFLEYPEQYRGDVLNEAFAVELFDMIESSGICHWVYGHHHSNTPEFSICKTKLNTNQLGYVHYNEQMQFKRNKVLDV